VIKIAMTDGAAFDIPALEKAIAAGPRLVFLSSPWNPVGPALTRADLGRLIAAVGKGTVFVLDEAYFEFANAQGPDALTMLHDSGVAFVVLRTFSKAYGLAGLRVGYAVCSDVEIARVVSAAKTPFNVNGAAQLAALAALADQNWMQASVISIRSERERVAQALRDLGFAVAPSQTNFLFVDCGKDSAKVSRDLLAQGIVIKAWREPGYTQFLRITIGQAAENDRLIAAMASVIGA
jgi:histidinol-phosphate aminotransferase